MIEIMTVAHKRPDFIELQLNSIKKHIKCEYTYTVFNNAVDSVEQRNLISNICYKLNVKCVNVLVDNNFIKKHVSENIFLDNKYINANVGTSYPIIWIFKNYITNHEEICLIDSDMFFINDINLSEIIADKDIVYIPQYRKKNEIKYIWNAFVCLNLKNCPNLKFLNWNAGFVESIPTDVGGQTHFFLKDNHLKSEYIHEYCIYSENSDTNEIHFILNGNINYNLKYHNNKLISFNHVGGDKCFDNKSFPHEIDYNDYQEYISSKVLHIFNLLNKNNVNLPKPSVIGFLGFPNDNFFILHYKCGSNYQTFSTDTYNNLKTHEIKKLL